MMTGQGSHTVTTNNMDEETCNSALKVHYPLSKREAGGTILPQDALIEKLWSTQRQGIAGFSILEELFDSDCRISARNHALITFLDRYNDDKCALYEVHAL